VTFVRLKFQQHYHNAALQLLFKFPLDHKVEDGTNNLCNCHWNLSTN